MLSLLNAFLELSNTIKNNYNFLTVNDKVENN